MSEKTNIGELGWMFVLELPTAIYWGWTLKITWAWFVVPVFAAPSLPIAAAIGISLMISMQMISSSKSGERGFAENLWLSLSAPTLLLVYGWVIQHWMP